MGVIHAKQRRESIPGRERSRAWREGWQELRLDLKQAGMQWLLVLGEERKKKKKQEFSLQQALGYLVKFPLQTLLSLSNLTQSQEAASMHVQGAAMSDISPEGECRWSMKRNTVDACFLLFVNSL